MKGTEKQRLNNGKRFYTTSFGYPDNCHYCISIRSVVFKYLFFSWTGHVIDCFIFHSAGLETDSALFGRTQALHLGNDSEKEVNSIYLESERL